MFLDHYESIDLITTIFFIVKNLECLIKMISDIKRMSMLTSNFGEGVIFDKVLE